MTSTSKLNLALAEASRLYGVTNPTGGERAWLATLTTQISAREAVDLLFGPDAKPYDAPGGLRDIVTRPNFGGCPSGHRQ